MNMDDDLTARERAEHRSQRVHSDQGFRLENTYAQALEGMYAPVEPKGFADPELRLLNRPLAEALGLDVAWLDAHGAAVLSASATIPESCPLAMAYAGHQFGHFNPQLGDGRALLLGEVVDPSGHRFDLHLKGSGRTPYSRGGDGLAALDSALREYIMSEAMFGLGIPTTRALAVVSTGESIVRERPKPGAVLARVASSHLRVGTLELFASQDREDELRRLVDYALRRHYPEHAETETPAKALLDAVAQAQGRLIARWMLVGFVHGVMNTDNVALSGETIDYGPCAFIDRYDAKAVFSQIDQMGRYSYSNQPGIGGWNMARMAEALLKLLSDDVESAVPLAQDSLETYQKAFAEAWTQGMRNKLGLSGAEDDDVVLAQDLLEWMEREKTDFTGTFRKLSTSVVDDRPAFAGPAFEAWHNRWQSRMGTIDASARAATAAAMNRVNPMYIPRNHRVEAALEAALTGDLTPTTELVEVLSRPFEVQPDRDAYGEPAPDTFGPYRTHCNT